LFEIKKKGLYRASSIFNVGTSNIITKILKSLALMSINVQEIKQGYNAQKHALLVAKNMKLLIKGLPNSKLATYSTGYPLALVSLGRKEGRAASASLADAQRVLARQDQI
jgi:hypothetical protein